MGFAIAQGYAVILTADADFQNKVLELGQPPKVIRIDRCNFSAREITDLIRREAVRIADFLASPNPLLYSGAEPQQQSKGRYSSKAKFPRRS